MKFDNFFTEVLLLQVPAVQQVLAGPLPVDYDSWEAYVNDRADDTGGTALHALAGAACRTDETKAEFRAILSLLIDAGANFLMENYDGQTPEERAKEHTDPYSANMFAKQTQKYRDDHPGAERVKAERPPTKSPLTPGRTATLRSTSGSSTGSASGSRTISTKSTASSVGAATTALSALTL